MNAANILLRLRTWMGLAKGARVLAEISADRVVRLLSPDDCVDRSFATAMRLALGAMTLGVSAGRRERINFARDVLTGASNATLARYVLPDAVTVLADSDPNRARALLRSGMERGKKIHSCLSRKRLMSLAVTSAYLGDAESVEFYTAGLSHAETGTLKERFAAQHHVAQLLRTSADYLSVRAAALSCGPSGKQSAHLEAHRQEPIIGMLEGCNFSIPPSSAVESVPVDREFPLALAAVSGLVWLPVCGSFGQEAYPGHSASRLAFPFPGNVRPLFTALHIADPKILEDSEQGSEALDWFRRFAPVGCRDLFTARFLRGAGVEAFVGTGRENRGGSLGLSELPQQVLDAVLEGKSEAEVYAHWREAAAPAMVRTDALIAAQNVKYPLPEVLLSGERCESAPLCNSLNLDQIPVQTFGPEHIPSSDELHLLFGFDQNLAKVFPGTLEGVWRHATRPLSVHVFGRGLSAAMFRGWAAQFPGVRLIWRDLTGFTFGDVNLPPHTTVSTIDRLLAPVLLHDVERAVWLDMDVLVRKDIADLFDIDLGDALLAGRADFNPDKYNGVGQLEVYDGNERLTEEVRETFRNAFLSNGPTVFKDFNAGVLAMNLAAMRRDRAVEKTLALVRVCGVNDNVALCLYVRRRWKPLADEWHIQAARELSENPAIVHFIGLLKPWSRGPFAVLFSNLFVVPAHGDGRARFWVWRDEWRKNADRAKERSAGSMAGSSRESTR